MANLSFIKLIFNLLKTSYNNIFTKKIYILLLLIFVDTQVTNSGYNKLYLSAIRDNINFYHICFCEYENNGYIVKYINGYLSENKFNLKTSSYLSEPSTCMYPELIKNNSKLLLSWVNYNKLFTCTSTNDGLTWSKPNIDEYSLEDNFIRSTFYSNYKDDLEYNISHVFSTLNDVGILGL